MNREVKNEFIKNCLFIKSMKGKILDQALTLRFAFLIIPSRFLLKLSLLSTLISSSFDDHYRWSACPHSLQIILLVSIITTKP